MSPSTTKIFRLPYVRQDEFISELTERVRFNTIDRQLEALLTFLGDGIISGWELSADPKDNKKVILSAGSGVLASIAAASATSTPIDSFVVDPASVQPNYIYAKLLGHTPYTALVDFEASTVVQQSNIYLQLGTVYINSNGTINRITDEGRTELTLITKLLGLISEHVHTGAPGEPSKIDLFNHVRGVLSAANIEDLPASKITSGIIPKERFRFSHKDLKDIGTLTHEEVDSLIEKFQNINVTLFGDLMTANLIQLILSLKHVWENVDDYMINFAAVIPGIANNTLLDQNTFIDINATTAEVDYVNHRIRGKYVPSQEIGQITVNTESEWKSGEYDSNFVAILNVGGIYGYGYGYGQGLEYFDVLSASSSELFENSDVDLGVSGSKIGYGVSTLSGADFETYFNNAYGYGYGFEYGLGFPETLASTLVTLVPKSANLNIHDKNIDILGSGDAYNPDDFSTSTGSAFPQIQATSVSDINNGADVLDLLIYAADKSDRTAYAVSGNKRRSSLVNTDNPSTTNLYPFTSDILDDGITHGGERRIVSDKSLIYSAWQEPYDMTDDRYIYFKLTQKDSTLQFANSFDPDWVFDHSCDLIVEVTIFDEGIGSNGIGGRYFYRYHANADDTVNYRFFDKDEDVNNLFKLEPVPINNDRPASVLLPAKIVDDSGGDANLEFLGGYDLVDTSDTGTEFGKNSNPDPSILTEPVWTIAKQNVTGVYLVAKRDDGYDIKENISSPMVWPQGRRNELKSQDEDGFVPDEKMLVDIDEIYVGGSFGYGSNPDNNKVDDISISFPDKVDFTSISWISEEPSDSVIYIQVAKSTETSYRQSVVYTNKDELFQTGGAYDHIFSDPSEISFLVSGSNFDSTFKNTQSIKLRVVLLPSSSGNIAPSISSISVNYTSRTSSGRFTISTKDQWTNARKIENVTVNNEGSVFLRQSESSLGIGKVNNVIYGTDRKIVEHEVSSTGEWGNSIKQFTGYGVLPRTSTQILNETISGISGYVTDLKKRKNGNIIFLDREASRIVELDAEYSLKQIIASEYVYNDNDDAVPESAEATFLKSVYNRQLGDYGVLYLVFSHELAAWSEGVKIGTNVRPERFHIRRKGSDFTLMGISPVVCDRGILCFPLTPELQNWIESLERPIIDMSFDADSSQHAGSGSAVTFKKSAAGNEIIVDDGVGGNPRIELEIEKIGSSLTKTSYNLIYAPIQGVVAFDVDDENRIYLLKKTKPYIWDTVAEIWFARISTDRYWTTWEKGLSNSDSYIQTSAYFKDSTLPSGNSEPNFFLSNTYGNRGSIHVKGDFMLLTISGEKLNGVLAYKLNSDTGQYDFSPTKIMLQNDGTWPMAARFDPVSFTDEVYGSIYVALSDLKRNVSGNSKSKVIKITDDIVSDETIEMIWGEKTNDVPTFAVSVNDVYPLMSSTVNGVVVST